MGGRIYNDLFEGLFIKICVKSLWIANNMLKQTKNEPSRQNQDTDREKWGKK